MAKAPPAASEGQIVHVYKRGVAHCIPAVAVRAWGDGTGALNLLLLPDGSNDGYQPVGTSTDRGSVYALPWATSLPADESANREANFTMSWHWPERV